MTWIYRYEVKGIQRYLTRTNKLREIKGGSVLIEELSGLLDRTLKALDCEAEREQAAAGGGTLSFRDESSLMRFASVWPMLVEHHVPGVNLVQAWVGEDEDEAQRLLQARLREDRSRLHPDLPEAGPATFRAPRSGLPALPFTGDELQDPSLARRAEAGDDRFGDSVGERLGKNLRWALDFDRDMDSSFIAVVHADGNDLGLRLRGLDRERRRIFSEALDETTVEAARRTISTLEASLAEAAASTRGRVPLRPVVLGGDDFTVIVRADLALSLTRTYLEAFEAESEARRDRLGGPLTACAGIAIVHSGYPFHAAHRLAEDLCKFAKERCRRMDERGPSVALTASSLAFHRVTTTAVGDYERDVLNRELSITPEGENRARRLTAGPYVIRPLAGMRRWDDLMKLADAMKPLPRGGVRTLIGLMKEDPRRADEALERMRSVLSERKAGREQWKRFSERARDLGCDGTGWIRPENEGPCTPFFDAWSYLSVTSLDTDEDGER